MKNTSGIKGVVAFDAEGYTFQALWDGKGWDMAAMEQKRIVEKHFVAAPADASPGALLTAWWKAQKEAGTYTH